MRCHSERSGEPGGGFARNRELILQRLRAALGTTGRALLGGITSLVFAALLHADVLVVGDALNRSADFARSLRAADLAVRAAGPAALADLDPAQTPVVVLASEKALPPNARLALNRFIATGGHVVVVGAHLFDYAPRPTNPVALGRFAAARDFRVVETRVPREKPHRETIAGPDGKPALQFSTTLRGFDDFRVELDATALRARDRSVIEFWARGDAYMDLLALEILDNAGQRWLGFVPIGREWAKHAISLADFLPHGWAKPDEPYPLLPPETIVTVGLGPNLATLWPEKPMTLALGSVDLAEDATRKYAPTSALVPLRLPFLENGIRTPAWLFDPFAGSQSIAAQALRPVGANAETFQPPVNVWLCPPPHLEHPGPRMGSDHRKDYILKFEHEIRRIPWCDALAAGGAGGGPVAELRVAASGKLRGTTVALFGIPVETILSSPVLRQSLTDAIVAVATRPKVAGVTINTTSAKMSGHSVVPTLTVVLQNPRARAVTGNVVATVAAGALRGEANVTVPPRATAAVTIALSAVPADFPFTKFDWRVALETDGGRDEWRDRVDLERGLLHASRHMVGTQQQFPDGRISNHYFADIYGARAMLAYADLVRREPERLQANADLWQGFSPAQIEAAALRFCDMLVRRQNPDGSVPMGYGEQAGTYNIADTGSMALGIGQVIPLLPDSARGERYLAFCRAFAGWAETFYIDAKLSAKLTAEFPDRARKGEAKAGHYGIGQTSRGRTLTGPSWVLPDILGAQILLQQVDGSANYQRIADRNLRAYLDAGYGSAGYFHAEALVWGMLATSDPELRRRIADNLRTTFIATLLQGEANDMYDRGARAFLNGLALVYYRRLVEDNAAVRALLLKYAWAFAAEDAPNGMRRVAETFPKPVHGESIAASKQASCGAIWAMELLEPGATLLRSGGSPRGKR